MATLVLTDAYVLVNSVDLSDHVKSVTIDYKAELQDASAMSSTTRKNMAGAKDWTITIEFHQDFAASSVDATLFPLVGNDNFAIEVRPTSAARSATNPAYVSNSATLESYGPVSGSYGEVLGTQATFRPGSGSSDLQRLTA